MVNFLAADPASKRLEVARVLVQPLRHFLNISFKAEASKEAVGRLANFTAPSVKEQSATVAVVPCDA